MMKTNEELLKQLAFNMHFVLTGLYIDLIEEQRKRETVEFYSELFKDIYENNEDLEFNAKRFVNLCEQISHIDYINNYLENEVNINHLQFGIK